MHVAVIRRLEQVAAWKVREEERQGLVVVVRGAVKVMRGWVVRSRRLGCGAWPWVLLARCAPVLCCVPEQRRRGGPGGKG